MKIKIIILLGFIILSCYVGYSSTGVFGTGVSIALDQESRNSNWWLINATNLRAKLLSADKGYVISVKAKILDGRIFLLKK